MIQVKNLVKRFGSRTILRKLNFSVEPGEFVAVLGPNGAGKTTFLRILASLSRPSMGDVQVAGLKLPAQATAVRYRLGVVSHLPLLYGDLSARENLKFYALLYGVPDIQQRIDEVLELVGLQPRQTDLVRTFSRGMQQRLAIGRAILHDPEILLLDEPHTGLDQAACEMLDEVLALVTSIGRTVVMTSHDMARASELANRFDILARGRIQASTQKSGLPRDGLLAFYRETLENTKEKKVSV